MIRPLLLSLALTLSTLALVSCGEITPTQPGTADESPLAPSFDLARNGWSKRARLPDGSPRRGLAAGVVNNSDGQPILYLLGGYFDDFVMGRVYAYSYSKNAWTTKAAFVQRSRTNGVGRIGGKLYISGGYLGGREGFCCEATQRTLYVYDPVADRLIQKADMPRPTAEGVTGVINGKLYVLSGTCSDDEGPVFECDVQSNKRLLYRYDPATNTWSTLPPAPHNHANGAGGVINGKFYVAGGNNDRRLDIYDPVTNSWRAGANLPEVRDYTAGVILQSKLYVIGGDGPSGQSVVFAYDPRTNTWKTRASLKVGRTMLAAAPLVTIYGNPKILAVGGYDGSEAPGANDLYTP